MKLSFTAFTRPLCESDITILTPDRPVAFKYSKILDQEYLLSSSFIFIPISI